MKVIEKILWNKVIREAEYDKKEMEECVTKFQKLRVEPYERLVKRLKSLSKVLHLMGIHTLKYRNFDYLKYDRKGLVELIKLYVNRIKPRYYETLNDQEFQRLKDTLDFEYLAEGGFSKVYRATWINEFFDKTKKRHDGDDDDDDDDSFFHSCVNKQVVLKSLHNSKNITKDFLNEIKAHIMLSDDTFIIRCYDFQPRNADNFDDDDFFYESSTINSVKSEALDCKIISDEVNSVDL
ncbi:unnamed protein product [Rhizophagus irregularis]|nr:unnamed protein product [Rhizophagus irregularis]